MSLLNLPDIRADFGHLSHLEAPIENLERWNPQLSAKEEGDNTISIYDGIGENWDGTGVTAKRIDAALRSIGKRDVVVNINSPGGSYFEGVAIYNLLRNHPAKVTVNVLGLAASAASIITMAGDEILMGDGANIMIHNAMGLAYGNKEEMQEVVSLLSKLDDEMAEVYVARTGQSKELIKEMMSVETWLSDKKAVEEGFATGYLHEEVVAASSLSASDIKNSTYLRLIENSLKKEGKTRSQRREILSQIFTNKSGAVSETVKPSADEQLVAEMRVLLNTIRNC